MQADFYLLMLILFLMPIAGIFTVVGKPVQISDLLFLIYFLVWSFKRIILKIFQVNTKFYLFCSLFITLCLSTYFSPFLTKSAIGLIIKIYLLTLAYIISEEINSFHRFKWAINVLFLSGIYVIFLSFWGMMSFVKGSHSIFLCPSAILDLPLYFLPRVQSVFSSPSFLSSFLIIIIMTLLGRVLFKELSFKELRYYKIYIVLAVVVFIFTFSRDLIGLGWGLIFLVKYWDISQNKNRLIIMYFKFILILVTLFVLVITIWYIFPIKIYQTSSNIILPLDEVQYKIGGGNIISQMGWISEKFISFNSHLHNRFMELRDAWRTFLQNPIVGIGVGVLPSQGYFPHPYSRSSHNTYLQILSQTGILGFVIFLVFIIYLFKKLKVGVQDDHLRSIKIIFKSLLIAFLLNMLFIDLDNFRYFWILVGLIFSLENSNLSKINSNKVV